MIDYQLIYTLCTKSSFSFFDDILVPLIFYIFLFIVWKNAMNGELKKFGIFLTLIYVSINIETIVKKTATPNVSHYRVVEGEVSNWVKASYYNRKGGSFVVNGVTFTIHMKGIDKMYNTPLHFANGRRVKIYYIEKNKIVKFWIEDYRIIWEKECHNNDYFACFELSRAYQKDNRKKAQEFILKSTESNMSKYSLLVSMLYKHGILFEKNATKADFFDDKASEKKEH